jgi:hypothetical protein
MSSNTKSAQITNPWTIHSNHFRDNVIILIDECILMSERINKSPHIVNGNVKRIELKLWMFEFAKSALRNMESSDIIVESFLNRCFDRNPDNTCKGDMTNWTKIKEKDDAFMINNASVLFHGLPEDQIIEFSKMFTITDPNGNLLLPNSEKEKLWKTLKSFVQCSIRYIHHKRMPTKTGYTVEYRNVSVKELVKEWDVKM